MIMTVEIDKFEATMIIESVAYYEDAMLKYKNWIETREGKPLPGCESAIKELEEDIRKIRALRIKLYETQQHTN